MLNLIKKIVKGAARFALYALATTMAVAGITLMVVAFTGLDAPQYQSIKDLPVFDQSDITRNSPEKHVSLIAIMKEESGKIEFHCSAFVISDKLAVTAAHCVIDENGFLEKDELIIVDTKDIDTKVRAKPAAANLRADMAVITGDFSGFNKAQMSGTGFINAPGPFGTCGFPWGAFPALCTDFVPKANYYAEEKGDGHIFPGMSGGPVIDYTTGLIVGINTEIHDGFVSVAPTMGILGALELKLKTP